MESLPPDITLDILSRLPVESVLQCRLVCKTWRTVLRLSSTFFGDMHLGRQLLQFDDNDQKYYNNHPENGGVVAAAAKKVGLGLLFSIGFSKGERLFARLYYYGDYDEIKNIDLQSYKKLPRINHHPMTKSCLDAIVGSCNGLVCFLSKPHNRNGEPVYICNPITREYINLPRFHLAYSVKDRIVSGFGYHPSTNEYKVVRIYYPFYDSPGVVHVYTLGGGSGWRYKGEITHKLCFTGVLVNGALHWLDNNEQLNIVAFDLADEEFSLLPSPPCLSGQIAFFRLQVLGGCLCVVHKVQGGEPVDIWSLKKKKNRNSISYDVKEQEYHSWSWSREFTIARGDRDRNDTYQPFALTKSNEILLWYKHCILSCYDPKTATLKKLWHDDHSLVKCQAILHMNSFVSLKAMGEKSKRRRYHEHKVV
ncbi:F-box domain [Macleaya cordata]|uniref:F-box domain n=1 Tax=Macleaya cordata TaxID=56857 RepID=A0A200QAI1_MACCD|nr:F-box domain [Macleaya cordata]